MQYTWNDIEHHIVNCTQCSLSRTRNRPVMGRGSHQADIMLIAEAPGGQEDLQGIPFVGNSGEILDRLLRDCGLSREEIYITNIIKCHPPGNRDPKEEEKEACFSYLKYETFLLKPRIIVCLGCVAAQRKRILIKSWKNIIIYKKELCFHSSFLYKEVMQMGFLQLMKYLQMS